MTVLGEEEKPIKYFYGEFKRGFFGPKEKISLFICPSTIEGSGFKYETDGTRVSDKVDFYVVPMEKVITLFQNSLDGLTGITVEYADPKLTNKDNKSWLFIPNISDPGEFVTAGINAKTSFKERKSAENRSKIAKERELEKQQESLKIQAADFYNKCFNFHVKKEYPVYNFQKTETSCLCSFVDSNRNLNFLKINGETKEEVIAQINYDEIHYFDKAGSVQYVNDIKGEYTSYGGSFTGSSISKLASIGGGLLFGVMGMTIGAALTYKPSNYQPPKTDFKIDSDIKKIDTRNVLLNFYSQEKKQYIDIGLPLEMFNFLQTYYPEKKSEIVLEIERKTAATAAQEKINSGILLPNNSTPKNQLETKASSSVNSSDDLSDFQKKVNKLKIMKEAGLLSEEEFQEEKVKLLNSI